MSWYRFHVQADGKDAASILRHLGFLSEDSNGNNPKIYRAYDALAIEYNDSVEIWSQYKTVIDPMQKKTPGASEVETVTIS